MENFLEKMLRLPMDVMISSMETMAKTMHEIQRKAESHDEASPGGEKGKGKGQAKPTMFGNVPNLALTPLFEMYKIPTSGLVSGFETLSHAMDEIRQGPRAAGGTREDESPDIDDEVVALNDKEAAMEQQADITEGQDGASVKALWQIGRAGRSDYTAKWTASFDYQVGKDIDPLNSPRIPHLLTVHGGPQSEGATEKLNLRFALERDYGPGELALIYDRWGGEKDQVYVDDKRLSPVRGAGRGKMRHVALSLGQISQGDHVITLTASGDTTDKEHRIDCLKLLELKPQSPAD